MHAAFDAPDPVRPIWRVALPLPLPRLFDYHPPHDDPAPATAVGCRVRVPLGASRELVGVVVAVGPATGAAVTLK
ncbi:hypothetical protein SNE32_15140, partial [Lysobacter sp. D1-1-M9]|uniref:primosomal protein N' family DNA-binding protein n=1 Tax=Novilysobacter longmucuonensis TaxID=3098603 RepID=UPI002FC79C4D